ncbi:MAG: trypsin-like peptidase domain-containing protein [Candidatus Beckwithbacteria bacterium]|nr:trypsin-like peptidase domain-containing protein [Candidatus Beckwithbacteria bacterium]
MKRRGLIFAATIIVIVVSAFGGAKLWPAKKGVQDKTIYREVLQEENVITKVVDSVTPSVVTVGVKKTQKIIKFDPFGLFSQQVSPQINEQNIEQDIGSGFVISANDGLVITNKHVVADLQAEYKVITADNTEMPAEKIYRDPVNDLAIIKVTPPAGKQLKEVKLGNSDTLKVGQTAIAIGTALGEFRSTVTTGVISGLGRGINAGSPLDGASERLDNVIQTSAAINPGNSGGPLLNSSGEVIGVNAAVSQTGQNIGFALPINIVKAALDNFNQTGKFSRPFLGVKYQMLDQKTAILNSVPQGAYVVEVVAASPADKAAVKSGDIITQIDGVKLDDKTGVTEIMANKRVGDEINLKIYRDGKEIIIKATLQEAGE